MANHHTRGLLCFSFSLHTPTLYKQLSLSQTNIRVQWSVNIYQQIKTERGNSQPWRAHRSVRRVCVSGRKCVWKDSERVLMCLFFFPVTAAKQKTLMREEDGTSTLEKPAASPPAPFAEKWRWKALTNRTRSHLPWAPTELQLARRPVGLLLRLEEKEGYHKSRRA